MKDLAKWLAPVVLCGALASTPIYGPRIFSAAPLPKRDRPPAQISGLGPRLVADRGKFKDMVNGQQVGTEEFAITPSQNGWVATGSAQIRSAKGAETHLTSVLRLRADGTPVHYQWRMEGAKRVSSSIVFDKGTATVNLQVAGAKPFTQQFFFKTPRVAILDDNFYYQYAILASLYDWSKKGPQTIPVLIPQERTPGSVTVEARDPENVDGKNLDRIEVSSPDLQIMLYFEGNRLVRISVPSANAEILRE